MPVVTDLGKQGPHPDAIPDLVEKLGQYPLHDDVSESDIQIVQQRTLYIRIGSLASCSSHASPCLARPPTIHRERGGPYGSDNYTGESWAQARARARACDGSGHSFRCCVDVAHVRFGRRSMDNCQKCTTCSRVVVAW